MHWKQSHIIMLAGIILEIDLKIIYHVMSNSPDNIINFEATHNTVIRIGGHNTINQIYFPRQFQFPTFEGTKILIIGLKSWILYKMH